MKAADVTVEGVKVKSFTPAADWKTATVTLDGTLAPNTDKKVSVKVGSETKEFTVNYKFGPQAVTIASQKFDDDTANQRVAISVDGKAVTVDYLTSAGYTVEFNAYNPKTGEKDNSIFADSSSNSASATGKLLNNLTTKTGDYLIQVVVSKAGTQLTSEKSTISISNNDNAATTAKKYTLKATKGGISTEVENGTLVVGETAAFSDVYVTDGVNTVPATQADIIIKSSDSSVISVGADKQTIKAEGLGTAVVTITYGNAKQEVTLTVKGQERKLAKVTTTTKTAIVGGVNQSLRFDLIDQYGDVYTKADTALVLTTPELDGLTAGNSNIAASDLTDGSFTVSLSDISKAGQVGTFVVRDNEKNILGQATVTTTGVNDQKTQTLFFDTTQNGYSKDESINVLDALDNKVVLGVSYLTSEGLVNGSPANLAGYKIKYDNKVVEVSGTAAGLNGVRDTSDEIILTGTPTRIFIGGIAAGSTKVSIYDKNDNLVGSKTITVAKGQPAFKAVDWKAPATINSKGNFGVKEALKVVESDGDDIVEGITLTSTPINKVRIDGDGLLYVDVDGSASNNTGDIAIGYVKGILAQDATNLSQTNIYSGNGYSIVAGSKGTITLQIVSVDGSEVLATKAVKVDVAATAADQAAQAQAQAQAKVDAATITYATGETASAVTQNLTLSSGVTWTSDKTAVISNTGAVTRPAYAAGDETVTLTATATVNGQTASKTFTVTVSKVAASTDASVSSVKVANVAATVDPNDSTQYTVTVPNGTTVDAAAVAVSATDSNAVVGTPSVTGSTSPYTVTVTVTAEDGTAKTYKVTVTVAS